MGWGISWKPPKIKIPKPKITIPKIDLQEQVTEGLESISDAGTTIVEQVSEGAESLTEAVNATVSGATGAVKDTMFLDSEGKPKSNAFQAVTGITIKNPFEGWSPDKPIKNPFANIKPPKVDLGSVSQLTEKVKTEFGELTENIDTAYKGSDVNIGLENVQKEGQKVITQVKQEGQKLLEGDFNLENAVKGTIKGIEDTYKGSDLHSVFQQTEDFIKDPTKGLRDTASDVKDEFEGVINQYKKAGENIVTTGQNIGTAFEDTFNTGMNVSTALGSNAAKQVMKAKSDLSSALTSAFGSSKGAGPKIGKKTSIGTLLERDRDKRRGGLSRSGTSRTLITGKY